MKYIRYRFKTRAVDDYRPLIDMAPLKCPYWCTGCACDESYATIVCYLPEAEDIYEYWDDAYDVDQEECDKIVYTDRFFKPSWIK